MKKQVYLLILVISVNVKCIAQIAYKDVAGIFYARCTSCHHTNASDYPFMNYSQTAYYAYSILNQLGMNRMPPWSADTTYSRFQHERLIGANEKQMIINWINGGIVKGDTTLAPPAPVYPTQFQLAGNADLTLGIGTFTSTSNTTDKYYCFSLPTGLTQDRIIRAFEVVPGNKAIVHHVVVTADTNGTYASDLSGSCYNIPGNLGIGTYAPGTKPTVFPSQGALQTGMVLKAGSKIILQMHYPAGSAGGVDSTKIRLYFYPIGTTGVRRIYSFTPLQNWSMVIPPNTVTPFSAYYPSAGVGIPFAYSAFGVMPHSHLLCKSIVYYAVNPGVDTIHLVRINNWDFEWQDYYTFKKLVKIPAGYRLYSKHVYDNTSNNPNNPNNPPITVYSNTGTHDEMLFDGMMYLKYQTGDELIDLEAIINNDPLLSVKEQSQSALACMAYPNPFKQVITLRYKLSDNAPVKITVSDVLGRTISTHDAGKQPAGVYEWNWNTSDLKESGNAGVYFYTITAGNQSLKGKLIKE